MYEYCNLINEHDDQFCEELYVKYTVSCIFACCRLKSGCIFYADKCCTEHRTPWKDIKEKKQCLFLFTNNALKQTKASR